jgi:hypothetical protein
MAAQAQYVDDATLAARQAARRAATAAGATPSGGWNPAADVPSITPAPVQAVPNAPTSRYGAGSDPAIDAKVDQIGQRARAFGQQVQASNINAQVGRAPGLQPGAPAGPSSPLNFRQAGNITPGGPTSEIPSIQPQTITTADMARAAPDSAFARRTPGAAYNQPAAGAPLSADELARMQRGAARVAGTNTATAAGTAAPQGPGFGAQPGAQPTSSAADWVVDGAGNASRPGAAAAQPAAAAAEAATPGIVSRVGSAARTVAGKAAGALGIYGGATQAIGGIGDIASNGANAGNVGDTAAGLATAALSTSAGRMALARLGGRANPVAGAAITGWDIGRMASPYVVPAADRAAGVSDVIGGTVNQIVHGAGKLIGQNWGADERDQENYARVASQYGGFNGPGRTATAPAAAAGQTGKPQVNFIDPYTSGAVGPPGRDGSPAPTGADIAMRSNLPGTAVINGRVLTPKEIDDASKRLNIVPSSAFTNAPSGVLYSEANGGVAPTSEQAMAMRERQGQSGPAGGGMGNGAQWDSRAELLSAQQQRQAARDKEMSRLTSLSETALAHGRKRAAAIFANLAGQYGGNTDYSPYLPAQARPNTPEEAALLGAQAENYQANAAESMSNAQRRQQIAAITDRIGQTTDPKQRAALEAQANAMNGRADLNRAYKVDVPTQDVDANGMPVKLQMLVSPDGTVIFDPRGTMTGKNINQQKPQGS